MSVRVTREGAIATVRFDRPSPSFASLALIDELRRVLARLERDDAVRVIVLRGARDGEFLAHLTIDEIEAMLEVPRRIPRALRSVAILLLQLAVVLLRGAPRLVDRLAATSRDRLQMASVIQFLTFDALERTSKITIAAIEGPCIGCGLEMALACDLRVASDRPDVLIGLPEARIGMIPGFGGTQRLTRAVGPSTATAMLLRGQLYEAAAARRIGLVHELLPAERFEAGLAALLEPLARRSPESVRAIRTAVRAAAPATRDGLFEELRLVADLSDSDTLERSMRAYRAWLAVRLEHLDPEAFATDVAALDDAEREWILSA